MSFFKSEYVAFAACFFDKVLAHAKRYRPIYMIWKYAKNTFRNL